MKHYILIMWLKRQTDHRIPKLQREFLVRRIAFEQFVTADGGTLFRVDEAQGSKLEQANGIPCVELEGEWLYFSEEHEGDLKSYLRGTKIAA